MQQSFQEVHIPSCVFMRKMYCFPASVLLTTGTVFKKAVLQPLKAKNTDYAWKGSSSRCLLEKSMLTLIVFEKQTWATRDAEHFSEHAEFRNLQLDIALISV